MYFKRFGVMTRSTFKVLFYLKRQAERNGKVPVMGRITVNGTISQFSCKLSVSPKLWDTRANKATGKSVAARCINEKLENIKTNIGKQYQSPELSRCIPAIRLQTGRYTVHGAETGVYREVRGLPFDGTEYASGEHPHSGQEVEANDLYGFPERLDRFRSVRRVSFQRHLP